jgi:hypothetical protein
MQAAATTRWSCRARSRSRNKTAQIHRNRARDELAAIYKGKRTEQDEISAGDSAGLPLLCRRGRRRRRGGEVRWGGEDRRGRISCSARGVKALRRLFIYREDTGARRIGITVLLGRKSDEIPRLTGFLALLKRQKPWTIPASIFFFTACDFSSGSIPLLSSSVLSLMETTYSQHFKK